MGYTIAGIDVSRSSVSVCILSDIPSDMKGFKRKFKAYSFQADRAGIEALLALPFDAAIIEPTGVNYSKIWAHHLEKTGKIIRWVGHRELKNYREGWKGFNKSDKLDCIALACYGIERWNRSECFIAGVSHELREICLQLESLNRMRSPIINRLRQQLAHECPEIAQKSPIRPWLESSIPGFLTAIEGKPSKYWEKVLAGSIGTGIGEFSRGLATQLIAIERQEYALEMQLNQVMSDEVYQPYLKVFEDYKISGRTAAVLLGAIFPIERFLENGKPIVDRLDGVKRYRSLASFKLTLGMGMVQVQSGEYEKWQAGGRADIRKALWRWCKMMVVINPDLEKPAIVALRNYYENGTEAEVNGEMKQLDPGVRNQRIMRVVRRMITMLFKDLVRSV
jgi:hypothetical protein